MRLTLLNLGFIAFLFVGCRATSTCDENWAGEPFGSGPLSGGCSCCENCDNIPKGAIPQPLGSYVCAWHGAHTRAADRDNRVLYSYEFDCGGHQLSADGKHHLRSQMAATGDIVEPIIVEAVEDADLTVRRRAAVIDYLVQLGIERPDDMVVIGDSQAIGLIGREVSRVAQGITAGNGNRGNAGGIGGGGRGGGSNLGGGGIF